MNSKLKMRQRRLVCEKLEQRWAMATLVGSEPLVQPSPEQGMFNATMVAGDSPDSPSLRVDNNASTSAFSGVGSITIATKRSNYICTGTPIDATHVVTAAHCVDINGDGASNLKDGIKSITFNLNYNTSYSSRITATSWVTHPDFTGFNRPSVNDDLAILTLSAPIPSAVPRYGLFTGDLSGKTITMVGYGQSGDGVNGYTVNASYTVKRVGQNVVDAFYAQDDSSRAAANEVFRIDFDRDDGSNGPLGGPSVGNLLETTLGGGDSGGPSFVFDGTNYLLAGINTFSQGTSTIAAPKFGSMAGGMSVPAYATWISQAIGGTVALSGSATSTGSVSPTNTAAIESVYFQLDDSAESASAPGWLTTTPSSPASASGAQGVTRLDSPSARDRSANTLAPSVVTSMSSSLLDTRFSRPGNSTNLATGGDTRTELDRTEVVHLAALDAYHAELLNGIN